ncbi:MULTISPECIES: glutamate 5-kinase [Prochlorococcus]|uniref:glutamate 5-kinase n=1 Tax=Prochlorococcus TaxID=1218 RepID=UPI0005338D3C|nr:MULTISPECIES: glutamate 5-kinase [Prochlorococcus]KGG12373.1 Glutamate 5-kinase [Prochlorococcus sp. MIT 0601]
MTNWVIKVGTSLLRGNSNYSTKQVIEQYCLSLSNAIKSGDKIVIVSSGAVGLGCNRLELKSRPRDLASLQAAASIGQVQLMSLYEELMSSYGFKVAQILLSRSDFESRETYRNASLTLQRLLDWNVLPIVNENDAVSNDELRYGDNDTLSALVATSIKADELVLLTDIDRLYSQDPKSSVTAQPITDIHNPKELLDLESSSTISSDWGTGGIKTKLIAARIATESGIRVQLADGRDPEMLSKILKGNRGGTVFHPNPKPIGNKKSWLAHALHPVGILSLDKGACYAIQNKGASLLLVGVNNVIGNFSANQAVKLTDQEGVELGRGISSMSSDAINNSINKQNNSEKSPIVIHRDVLVLLSELIN